LSEDEPDAWDHRNHLAISHNYLGELLRQLGGDAAEAEAHYRAALALETELARHDRQRQDWRQELTRAQNNLGLLLLETDRLADAEQSFQGAVAGLTALVQTYPQTPDYRADLARALINLGVVCRKAKKLDAAQKAYEGANAELRALVSAHPQDREYQYKWAVSHLDLGNLLLKNLAKPQEAKTHLEEARHLLDQLQRMFPGIPLYAQELANVEISLANALAQSGDRPAAQAAFEQALDRLDDVSNGFPTLAETMAELHSRRGIALGGLSYLALTADDPVQARKLVEEAIQSQSAAQRLEPANPEYRSFLEAHQAFLAQIVERLEPRSPIKEE
jgi:hypothetical protein